jgi:hypothetical protein
MAEPRLGPDPDGLLDTRHPYAATRPVEGVMVAVLDARAPNRGLALTVHRSRALLKNEVHELLVTDDPLAAPGRRVQSCAYLGFVEIMTGGVALVSNRVTIAGRELAEIVGFDETHLPNHLNIVLRTFGELQTGVELGIDLGDQTVFQMADGYHALRNAERL